MLGWGTCCVACSWLHVLHASVDGHARPDVNTCTSTCTDCLVVVQEGVDGFCFINAENMVQGEEALRGLALAFRRAIGMPTVDGRRACRCSSGWLWPGAASSQPHRPAVPAPCPPLADREGFILDAPPLADAICHDPLLKPLKLIAAPSDDSLLPRSGVRGFPHWGLWQQRNAGFGRDLMAFLAEGGCWASLVFGGQQAVQ